MLNKIITVIAVSTACAGAASVTINAVNSAATLVLDNTGTALSSGDLDTNGDGDLFEIGYFTGDTGSFTGTWVAITGTASNNPSLVTTVGDLFSRTGPDSGPNVPDGRFSTSSVFDTGTAGTTNDLPGSGDQLALRFYDSSSRAGSQYNTVTSNLWVFTPPADTPPLPLRMDLGASGANLVWEDNANAFRTSIEAVPEPSSTALLGLGGLALIIRRRR